MESSDLVGVWEISLCDRKHRIEFEHGTTSGRRTLRVDGREVLRRDLMFKLVGSETFKIGNSATGTIVIEPMGGFAYQYSLKVNGKTLKKFQENQSKIMKTWVLPVDGAMYRIVLEKDTLDIWVNGKRVETAGEFVEDGTETHFALGNTPAFIKTASSGHKRTGMLHALIIDNHEIPEFVE
ncbi:Fas apoptotic inhibitory molecule 1 [Lepeophtheirus salmonis]|uniref:Fas apoptotic inhibitory molecule 1 n=3 Tax=Lepeophtheirus salmonis TaxID=72036 RepID=A0A7R8CX68_LEPSM|nr:Fas apoptotic inhibitory molecule 1 [Lepeophtheirus salmonis]CAF2912400.1 Fas apoptotic inhibitory molecule 1 [Lepeophtheirus salmonis]